MVKLVLLVIRGLIMGELVSFYLYVKKRILIFYRVVGRIKGVMYEGFLV